MAEPNPADPPKVRYEPARLTALHTVYYEPGGGKPPVEARVAYDSVLYPGPKRRQPYHRELEAGPGWEELDVGWQTGRPGLLLIHNREDPKRRPEAAIEVSFSQDSSEAFHVKPGRCLPCVPCGQKPLYVRCVEPATAEFTVLITPE